jgi:hypothetical protein
LTAIDPGEEFGLVDEDAAPQAEDGAIEAVARDELASAADRTVAGAA